MLYLVLDFETVDPYLSKDINLGPGWVYKLHVESALSRAIGYAFCYVNSESGAFSIPEYRIVDGTALNHLFSLLLKSANKVIMHNAQYDLGYLRTLGIDIKPLEVYDTKIMAQLYNNLLFSYSLDSLSKLYLSSEHHKEKFQLVDIVTKHNLLDMKPSLKTYPAKATQFAYEHMDILQNLEFDKMARYATQDVVATGHLFLKFLKTLGKERSNYWSQFQLICTVIREKGLKVDMDVVRRGIAEMEPRDQELENAVYDICGEKFNINSPAQLSQQLVKAGLVLEKTAGGGDSTNKDWLTEQQHPLCKAILEYRECHVILNNYFKGVLDMQKYTCPEAFCGSRYGMVYPEMNLFGAKTGRFSSSSPNIQQIPKRSAKYGALCRSMFVPHNDTHKWYSLDWSNQEGRLATHYAYKVKAKGAEHIVEEWNKNPLMDAHKRVAALAGITRTAAKTINLGLIYSLGEAKLCKKLGLSTEWKDFEYGRREVAGEEGRILIDKYHKANPWLRELNKAAKESMGKNGFIKTLKGRVSRREHPRFDYKALNKLIQGSAADQCLAVLKAAYETGLDILCLVHDEFNIEGSEQDALIMQTLMEKTLTLSVPMPAAISVGESWGTMIELEEKPDANV